MKLKKFAKLIRKAVEEAGDTDPDVEVWQGDSQFEIKSIGQFGVVADVVIHLKEPCPHCVDGKQNDAEPGDVYANERTCSECDGTGWKKD